MHNTKLKIAMVAVSLLSAGMVANVANAANHREAPITALDKIADVTDWYTFKSFDRPERTVLMLGTDGLQEPANGPNFFPFSNEIKYEFKVDNNHDAVDDVVFQFFFSRLGSDGTGTPFGNNSYRYPENFTGFAGIEGDACLTVPAFPGTGLICSTPILQPLGLGLSQNGRLAPRNQPLPGWTQHDMFVIPEPIASLTGSTGGQPGPGLGLGEPQTYIMRIITNADQAAPARQVRQYGPFEVVPANAGARTYRDHISLSRSAIKTISVPGGNAQVFAGTTDDPFPVALGQSFDTINYALVCGGGVNTPLVELSQAGNCQANDVDGYNVNTIAVEVPTSLLTETFGGLSFQSAGTSPVIGTYGTGSRPRIRAFSAQPGSPASFQKAGTPVTAVMEISQLNDGDFVQISRMGNPLFNELIIGTGCKDIFSQTDAEDDGAPNNCRGTGTNIVDRTKLGFNRYPDFASFVLDPYLPRLVNALVQTQVTALALGCPTLGSLLPPPLTLTLGCATGVLEAPDAIANSTILTSPQRRGRDDMLLFTNYRAFNAELANIIGRAVPLPTIGPDPVADLLRLDTTIPPTSPLLRKRMGPLDNSTLIARLPALDPAGWPNGRRPSDDVVDGVVRVEMGVLNEAFIAMPPRGIPAAPHQVNYLIGDASQGNDLAFLVGPTALRYGTDLAGYTNTFPFVVFAQPGSNSRHIDVGEPGCILSPLGTVCPGPGGTII